MFKNLIFDWSGTLVDDMGPVIEATNAVLGKYGVAPFDREGFRRNFRLPYREFYEELLPGVALEELEAHFRPAFDGATSLVTVLPHAREKLEWAKSRGMRMFVLTSMDADAFARQLEEFGMKEFFEATYAGVLDKRDLIAHILDANQLSKAETAFVGDMTHDIETARHGGISSIAVLTGYHHAEVLAGVRPDITVPDLGVLVQMLEKREPRRPVATVGALIHDGQGKLLMIRTHKWSNMWGIPGGKIERGETCEQALVREIREETGLEISRIRFVMVQDCIDSPEFIRNEHFLLLNYLAEASSHAVELNEEAEEFQWLDLENALQLNLNQATKTLLQQVTDANLLP
ncbi:HAD hydrolase-like protein [Luteolibacter algae]|uniref:phosphoglycolate phosphatase n=1 Tax=Luteolibacter algae TaxID=454151 RepID=A0ABW5D956_9BACT